MQWDEIRTRAAQELHRHCDLIRHHTGRPPATVRLMASPPGEANFFFSQKERSERIELLRKHLPEEVQAILAEADEICSHRFRLLGYDNLDYGTGIDWHLDRVHGKRAPLEPWFKIPFLDFAAVGDHKVTWELNRHQHLITLAKAWLLSTDEKYVREIVAQWQSWMRANPYPLGMNWGSALEVAFRGVSWIWVDRLLGGAPGYEEFHAALVPEIAFHGRYISRYLSTYFSPNTHLLGEAYALFAIGTLYPQIAAAAEWQQTGWQTLLQEAQRQVRGDGVYFEQSLHYHVYALDFFLHARTLAERNGLNIPAEYDKVLGKMLDVIQALAQSGPPQGFGDDDGGRVFNPRRNRTEHMTDPLALGAVLFNRANLPAARTTEEAIWLFGEKAVSFVAQNNPSTPSSAEFRDGGIYVLADAEPMPQHLVFDTGPQGVGRCGHGHADALSLRFTMNGRRWLVDSGSGVYISNDPSDRNAFRGTGAHNTLRVDGADQANAAEPFSWTDIPTTRTDNWCTGQTFSYVAGSHDGFTRLTDAVTHRRNVLKVHGGACLVRYLAEGTKQHDLEVLWHLAPDLEARDSGEGVIISETGAKSGPSLSLITEEGTPWRTEITRTLISPAYGKLEPAPLIRHHARVPLPAKLAVVLLARSGAQRNERLARLVSMPHASVDAYELIGQNENHGFFFASDKRPWSFGPWASDAEVLYCRIKNEQLEHLVIIGGTSVSWQGKPLLKALVPSSYFEWQKRGNIMHGEPAPFAVLPQFVELTGASTPASHIGQDTAYAEKR